MSRIFCKTLPLWDCPFKHPTFFASCKKTFTAQNSLGLVEVIKIGFVIVILPCFVFMSQKKKPADIINTVHSQPQRVLPREIVYLLSLVYIKEKTEKKEKVIYIIWSGVRMKKIYPKEGQMVSWSSVFATQKLQ